MMIGTYMTFLFITSEHTIEMLRGTPIRRCAALIQQVNELLDSLLRGMRQTRRAVGGCSFRQQFLPQKRNTGVGAMLSNRLTASRQLLCFFWRLIMRFLLRLAARPVVWLRFRCQTSDS